MTAIRVWSIPAWSRYIVAVVAGLVLALLVAPTAAHAGDDSWTGNGDGHSWSDGMNWASMQEPQDGDSVTIAPQHPGAFPSVTGLPSGMNLQDLTLNDASLSGGDATVKGTFTFDVSAAPSRTLDASLNVTGDAIISGVGLKLVTGTPTFSGNTEVSAGTLETEFSGGITNAGDFAIDGGATVKANACCSSPDKFTSTGTVSVPSGTATLGFLDFVDQGSVSVSPGATLEVPSGVAKLSSGDDISGGGTLLFDQGAQVTLASNVAVTAGSTLQLGHEAALLGTGSLTGSGKFSWIGGNVSGNLTVGKSISTSVSGTETKFVSAPGKKKVTLTLNGPTTLSGTGELETHLGNITSSGRFQINTGATLGANTCCAAPDQFTNTGTLAVPASASGTATMQFIDFRDQGSVSVGAGSLLHVIEGPVQLSSGDSVSGGGTLEFDGNAPVALASNVTIASGTTAQLTGGATFTGTGSLSGSGRFAWTGGAVQGNLSVGRTVTTAISGTATKSVNSSNGKPVSLTLNGPTVLTGTGELELGLAATVQNLGTFTLKAGTTIGAGTCCSAPDRLLNGGTLVVAAKPSTATISLLQFVNSGTVKVSNGTLSVGTLSYRQTAGRTTLAGGSLTAAQPVDINGGLLTGFGTIHGSVVSGGTVQPSTTGGKLTITGSYTQSRTGELATVLTGTTPGTKFGQLVVNGAAKLAGALSVTTGGGFKPKKGQSFVVLSCKSRSGTFARHTGTPAYKVSYGTKSVKAVY
jgi:hypothetical protein